MNAVTQDFVEVPHNAMFIAYAGGFAEGLLIKLNSAQGLTTQEILWLRRNTGLNDPTEACRLLIEAYQVQHVTDRITS